MYLNSVIRGLVVVVSFSALLSQLSYAQGGGAICSSSESANTGGCVAYEHIDFSGMRQDLGPDRIYNYVGDRMNDKISSFRVSRGCRIIAWDHRDRGGTSQEFGECQYIGDDWNDRISSWQCECGCEYGRDTCVTGYVWREARQKDFVCVTPEVREQTRIDNEQAAQRRNPGGGAYGPNTCLSGYVWREAFPGDVVCVTPQTRAQAAQDNSQAAFRKSCRMP